MSKNIVLSGFMGSGKTVTGRLIAKKLNMEFIDLDKFIEENEGMSVSSIFEKYGEAYFRELEKAAATFLGESQNKVIACGGGTVLKPENLAALKKGGDVYFLFVTPQKVKERLKNDTTRPLLKGDKASTIDTLLKEREPLYKKAADFTVDSNGSPHETANQIIDIYKRKKSF